MILVVLVLLNAALTVVYLEVASVRLRYDIAKKQTKIKVLALESRKLVRAVADARRPSRLRARAAGMGLRLRAARHDDIRESNAVDTMVRH